MMGPISKVPPPLASWLSAVEAEADFRDASPREHYEGFAALCQLTEVILERHPDRAARYEETDPLPAESRRLIARLRRRDQF